jgi:dTDP-4-dehydrorhamnose 3,5-epimerase
MGTINIDGVVVTPLKIIEISGGNVLHAMKSSDNGYSGFGEGYFSMIVPGAIKAWKRHKEMTLNLIVPIGNIRFILFDGNDDSLVQSVFQEIELSQNNYCRLTVPPMVWMGFQCVGNKNAMLLNIANIPHTPEETDKKTLDEVDFDWGN